MTGTELDMSTSSVHDKSDSYLNRHFKWDSIKQFVFLAYSVASSTYNFDIFSKVLYDRVKIVDFIFLEITMGITYMFMDVFIKQYTKRIDCYQYLNPLLRGIHMGCVLQSLLWNIILAGDLADSIRYFFAGLHLMPTWSKCNRIHRHCVPTINVILSCRMNDLTNLNDTSASVNYYDSYFISEKNELTARLFVITIVWIINFFLATMTDTTLIKLVRISTLWRTFSTIFVLLFTLFYTEYFFSTAISQMFDASAPRVYASAIDRITFAFGIGLVGVYDFGSMSPNTMIDNAVVIFGIIFTTFALARSIIVRVLYLALTVCVKDNTDITSHYLLFVVLPLSSEFLHAQKVFTIYIFLSMMCSLSAYLAILTLTISKLLHNEFRSVKVVYMVGILCFCCCNLSYPVAMLPKHKLIGLIQGINLTVLYLGGFKVAVVMWLYGIEKFSTDIQFLLGFKPTQFWTTCWAMHPILTFFFIVHKLYVLINLTEKVQMILASTWILFSFCFVTIIQIKTIAKFIVRNNLGGVLKPRPKYGPLEPEDRARRRKFDVSTLHQFCGHRCLVNEECYECNHMPLMFKKIRLESVSETSLTNIFESGITPRKSSIIMDSSQMHLN
ncbi:PREDICTED: sodium-dependent nutrient amino acid transporter 1-like [Papilio polytes]|uniref:sodium-dependent nutrient amino acid transporter 1-like n=1 Tax=Papilio polytes TaxID=76194 RepID=UPI000676598B|nr:PREDICTED: sodium-dependent nutrient amino acid transporter 1-like [Papilio polytes]